MKRTTISRSSVPWLAAVLLWAAAAPAHAQDTTQASPQQADTLQMAATPQQPTPSTHVVQKGETLWGLAQAYLGDALLWPEIYRLNTMVVEDPHWIYPGEELRFAPPETTTVAVAPVMQAPAESAAVMAPPPAESVAVAPQSAQRETPVEAPEVEAPPPPPPVAESGPTVFAEQRAAAQPGVVSVASGTTYRSVRRGDFYASGFLTEGQQLPWGDVTDIVQRATVGGVPASRAAFIYETIKVRAPAGAEYHAGDSLLVVHLGREVPGGWGEIVMPTGIARVTHADGRDARAEVVQQFGWVEAGQQTLPLEPFRNPGGVRPNAVDNGVSGHVVALRSPQPVPNQQAVVFLDVGRNDGVVPGDVFDVIDQARSDSAASGAPPQTVARIRIVHVRDRSCTGLLMNIVMPGLSAGAPVRLVRKMPS